MSHVSIAQMRETLKKAPKYKGTLAWICKVDRMSDKQVIAIYYRMLRGGEL